MVLLRNFFKHYIAERILEERRKETLEKRTVMKTEDKNSDDGIEIVKRTAGKIKEKNTSSLL